MAICDGLAAPGHPRLRTAPSRLGDRAGVVGAATMVIEHVLAPEAIDRAISVAA
jgi:hypothetical protein